MGNISEKKVKELITELKNINNFKESNRKPTYWYAQKKAVVNSEISTDLIKEFLDEYCRVKSDPNKGVEKLETDDKANIDIERDEDGNIQYYTFEIFKKNHPTLRGKFDRREMEIIYDLYSVYGANLTQKIVSREFPNYSFVDFKRILRAFNIYKYDFAPKHLLEELSEDELIERHNRQKENNILRKVEKDQLAEANKLINKLAKENLELKKNSADIHIVLDNEITPRAIKQQARTDRSLILHLSDIHVGACLESGCLFQNEWNEEELERRLSCIIDWIGCSYGHLDTIIINFLGDYLDGMDRMTARRDHFMPQNMDNRMQFNVFVRQMIKFIDGITEHCNNLQIYAVSEGNHDGVSGYMAITALKYAIESRYPEVDFEIFDRFIGYFSFNNHTYACMHGKDASFMKKPFPLNLNDSTSNILRDWLDRDGIAGENIHIVKGDLHSNSLNSCRKFDYRNVLSLFGDSDYSQMNYPSNSYGVSYDLFIGENRTIGTFENF